MKNKKIMKEEAIKSYIDIETDIDTVIELLQSLKETYGETYQRIYFERDYWIDSRDLGIMGQRLETDEEYEKRVKDQEILIAQKLEIERQQYEALKAKFDKN